MRAHMDFLLPTITGGVEGVEIEFDGNMIGDDLTDADKQLAVLLLQLPRLIYESDSLFIWGVGNKKKRTAIRRRQRIGDDMKKDPEISDDSSATLATKASTTSKQWPEGSSPDTPLIFSFSSDRPDPKPLTKRNTVKRRREDYVLLITQLEKEKESLRREIEDFQWKMNEAMVANALLKRKREELVLAQEREKIAKLEEVNTDLTLGMPPSYTALSSSSTAVSASSVQNSGVTIDQHHPLILNRTDMIVDNGNSFFPAEMWSLQLKDNVGPRQVPDLNHPANEYRVSSNSQPSDVYLDEKTMAALARQKRRRIRKSKTFGDARRI